MKSLFSLLLVMASILVFSPGLRAQEDMPTTDETTMPEETAPMTEEATIGQTIAENVQTTTLNSAIEAAGLTEALNAEGSFILLAPTDEAFASLPDGVLDALLQPENADALSTLLQHHLVNSADEAATTTMQDVLENQQVSLGESMNASNGVVYLINQVLIPADFDLTSLQSGN